MRERVLLFTGGLDSVAAFVLLDKPKLLYVCLGEYDALPRDHEAAFNACELLGGTMDIAFLPWATAQPDGHIPLRNLHLATAGALYGDRVILGAVKGESSPDKSDRFLRLAGQVCTAASQGRRITVEAPLKKWTKRQLVKKLIDKLGHANARALILETRSCYSQDTERCGKCMACFRRWVALSLNGIFEQYDTPPWETLQPAWPERIRYLRQTPAGEWSGILQANLEAAAALARVPRANAARPLFPRRLA
jgi:7-cyano-7-deazaguanine synthase in queuosine biosynthesis